MGTESRGFSGDAEKMPVSYYQVLGVSKDADRDTIKRAFLKLAKITHPDVAGGDERKFKEIAGAWEVLGDAETRARYDRGEVGIKPSGVVPRYADLFGGDAPVGHADIFGQDAGAGYADVFGVEKNRLSDTQETARERIPTVDEVRGAMREWFVKGEGKETDERSDADGVWLLEIQVEGPKPGEVTEYTYRRAGTFGRNKHARTTVEAVFYEDGIPVGGETVGNFIRGVWVGSTVTVSLD